MLKYGVIVEEAHYRQGYVYIEANSPKDAVKIIQGKIDSCTFQFEDADNWGDLEYQEGSLQTTGDTCPAPEEQPEPEEK